MKILFVADIHINLRHKKVPKDFAIKRTRILWSELHRIAKEYGCEVEVHGGDMFDKLPNLEELSLYADYLYEADREIIAFPGNHEATSKYKTFLTNIQSLLEYVYPNFRLITDSVVDIIPGFDILPYNELHRFKHSMFKGSSYKALFTHVRGEIPPHVKPEIDLDLLEDWDVVFAGDLHSHSNTQRNIVYPGSPLSVSFHRSKVKTGVLVIDSETKEWEWVEVKVPQLYKKTVSNPDDIVETDFDLTIYEFEGDAIEAKEVKDNKLVDKRIVRRETEATLDLKGLTIREELVKYWKDVSLLKDKDIKDILFYYEKYKPKDSEME